MAWGHLQKAKREGEKAIAVGTSCIMSKGGRMWGRERCGKRGCDKNEERGCVPGSWSQRPVWLVWLLPTVALDAGRQPLLCRYRGGLRSDHVVRPLLLQHRGRVADCRQAGGV